MMCTHSLHVQTGKVKRRDMAASDNELVDEFFSLLPAGETPEVTAGRVDRDRTQIGRWKRARDNGENVTLQDGSRTHVQQAIKELRQVDPEGRARREAYRLAAEEAQALADRFAALATSPPSGDAKPAVFAKEGAKTKKKPGPKRATGGS